MNLLAGLIDYTLRTSVPLCLKYHLKRWGCFFSTECTEKRSCTKV